MHTRTRGLRRRNSAGPTAIVTSTRASASVEIERAYTCRHSESALTTKYRIASSKIVRGLRVAL